VGYMGTHMHMLQHVLHKMNYAKPSLVIMQCSELYTYVSLVTYLSTSVILHLCGGKLVTYKLHLDISLAMYLMPQRVH